MQQEEAIELENEFKLFDLNDISDSEWDIVNSNEKTLNALIVKHFEDLSFKHYDIDIDEENKTLQITITLEQLTC